MQLAAAPSTSTNRDKTTWPALQPLPHDLPAAATTRDASFPVAKRFTAGSFADQPNGRSLRIATGEHHGAFDAGLSVSLLAGRDPRAALAAAVDLAATKVDVPGWKSWQGIPAKDHTLVGVYQARSGAFMLTPLYYSPGTSDAVSFYPVRMSSTDTPGARFRFTDAALTAVVGLDGMIVNPSYANVLDPHA